MGSLSATVVVCRVAATVLLSEKAEQSLVVESRSLEARSGHPGAEAAGCTGEGRQGWWVGRGEGPWCPGQLPAAGYASRLPPPVPLGEPQRSPVPPKSWGVVYTWASSTWEVKARGSQAQVQSRQFSDLVKPFLKIKMKM